LNPVDRFFARWRAFSDRFARVSLLVFALLAALVAVQLARQDRPLGLVTFFAVGAGALFAASRPSRRRPPARRRR